jgi:RTA1 like protein
LLGRTAITMPTFKCYPIDDKDTIWLYCPSYAAAISFCVFFGVTTLAHIIQASVFRKPFAFVLIMGGIWETGGYAFRILSVRHQLAQGYFIGQQLLIILAPLWINAFVYMVLGRMIHFYLADDRVFGVRARRITLMFVLFDITAFLIQATGGMMINSAYPAHVQKIGMNTYMAGIGVQIFFICVFMTLAAKFQRLVKVEDFYSDLDSTRVESPDMNTHNHPPKSARQAVRLLFVIYGVLLLIIFRNIYRLIEFSAGVESSITRHEWYTFVFDSVPMLSCLIIFNIFHPGHVLRGPRSDFSEENRQKKEEKKMKKMAKKGSKDEKKAEMLMQRLERKEAKRARKEEKRQNTL